MPKPKHPPPVHHKPARTKPMPTTRMPDEDPPKPPIPPDPKAPPPPGGHPPSGIPKEFESTTPDAPKPAAEKALPADEARALLGAGHRLRKAGDPPTKWVTVTRVNNETCFVQPLADVDPKNFEGLVLIPPPYN